MRLCPRGNFQLGLRLEAYVNHPGGGAGMAGMVEAMRREHAGDGLFRRRTGEPVDSFEAEEKFEFVSPPAEWN